MSGAISFSGPGGGVNSGSVTSGSHQRLSSLPFALAIAMNAGIRQPSASIKVALGHAEPLWTAPRP